MKKILHIARNELYSLFYSPIAWILMILFIVLTSIDYISMLDFFAGSFQRGGPNLSVTENMTSNMLPQYLFSVIRNLYIFFPLITMGLISREIASGTIKMLYSSPVRTREVVLGKYLAVLCFTGCLLVLLSFTLAALAFSVVHPDYGQILASLFGLFLVLATYAAIGLFISSLTSYPIVAAIITLGVFALFSRVGDLWQDVGIVRHITYYMDIGAKSFNFIRGLANLRDFTYFMILIVGFISLAIIRIKSATESIPKFKKALRYAAVILVGLVAGYITSRPDINVYYDATRNKLHTITPPTQQLLSKLDDGKLEITGYCNLLSEGYWSLRPSYHLGLINEIWEPYIRFKPDIDVQFVSYYNVDTTSHHYELNRGKSLKEIAEKEAKSYRIDMENFLPPEQVDKQVNTRAEEFRNFFKLKYKDKETILRTFDDMRFWPSEDEIAAAINRLVSTPPVIGFLTDEIGRGPFSERARDYKKMTSSLGNRYALINQGYDVDTFSLKGQGTVPKGIAALVIADPRSDFAAESLHKIDSFIDSGGNLFLAGEPDRKNVLRPILDKLGISFREGILVQPSEKTSSNVLFARLTDSAKNLSPQFYRELKNDVKYFGDTVMHVAMEGASALDYKEQNGFRIYPLLVSDKRLSWNRLNPISNDSLQLKVNRLPNDEPGEFATVVRMNRNLDGKEQRIIVAGDADYLSTPLLFGWDSKRYNYNFGFWCFSYFSYGSFPANTLRPEGTDNAFRITVGAIPVQKMIFYWVIPGVIAIISSVLLIRRKRK